MPTYAAQTYRSRPLGTRALRRELFWHQLRRRRFASLEEVRSYQLTRLRELVRHAALHVPFYHDRFRSLGIEADDIRTFEDYARLPILTRDDVLAHLPELRSRAYREDELLLLGTGGSTGVPMPYYKEVDYLDRSLVVLARSHLWAGKGRFDLMALFTSKREPPGLWGEVRRRLRARTESRLFFDTFGASPADLEDWVRILWRYRPPFAYGYPSFLEYFARWLAERGLQLPALRGLFVSAETLYPQQRELLGRTFQTSIYNLYGSREVQNIASTCAAQSFHQVADWVMVEFVPDAALPAPRLVVTPLEGFGMPLIRYANGDLGKPAAGSCPCGLPFPLMDISVARVVDVFVTPEGKRIWGQFFTHLMYGVAGIKQFQFHQTATDRIRLLLVKDESFDAATEVRLRQVVTDIHARASQGIRVDIEYVREIKQTAAGKFIFTRSDVSAGAPRANGNEGVADYDH